MNHNMYNVLERNCNTFEKTYNTLKRLLKRNIIFINITIFSKVLHVLLINIDLYSIHIS